MDQIQVIYVNLRLLYVNLRSIYISLRRFTFDSHQFVFNLRHFTSIYVGFTSICVRFTLIYIKLRQFASKFDKIWTKMFKMVKYISKKCRDVIFSRKKSLRGATQHRTGLANNVIWVIYIIYPKYIIYKPFAMLCSAPQGLFFLRKWRPWIFLTCI